MKQQATGCTVAIIICLTLAAVIYLAAGWASDKAADYERARGDAQAQMVYAQGQAALNRAEARAIETQASAQAQATMINALAATAHIGLAWGVLALVLCAGAGLFVLALAIINRPYQAAPAATIIERHVYYLPAPGQSRREMWQVLAAAQPDKVLLITGKATEVRR